jgi:hypothetical protein
MSILFCAQLQELWVGRQRKVGRDKQRSTHTNTHTYKTDEAEHGEKNQDRQEDSCEIQIQKKGSYNAIFGLFRTQSPKASKVVIILWHSFCGSSGITQRTGNGFQTLFMVRLVFPFLRFLLTARRVFCP